MILLSDIPETQKSGKESLAEEDSLGQRLKADRELRECVQMLVANRGMVGAVVGYMRGCLDERDEQIG